MSLYQRVKAAVCGWPRRHLRQGIHAIVAIALAAATMGCRTTPPMPLAGPDPSVASVRTPAVAYRSTIEPYASERPVAPAPWRERNEQVAPKARQ